MNNEPAFPHKRVSNMYPDQFVYEGGMMLRDYFAAHAPEVPQWYQELFRGRERNKANVKDTYQMRGEVECMAEWKFYYSDAMLAEREKGQHGKD